MQQFCCNAMEEKAEEIRTFEEWQAVLKDYRFSQIYLEILS